MTSLVVVGAVLAVGTVLGVALSDPANTLLCPAIVRGPEGSRFVALTFDDGPSEPYTSQILDVLRERHVKATFFICGASAERYPDLVRRIKAEGHEIGNHTYDHPYLVLKSREAIAGEIDRTQDIIQRLTGTRPTLFRPPFGVRWFSLRGILRERSLKMVLWSLRPLDGRLDAHGITRLTMAELHPGAVICLHDGFEAKEARFIDRSATVRALPAIIEGVRRMGYTFGPLSGIAAR